MLKGQLIARKEHLDINGKFKLKNHDLRQFAIDNGYSLDEIESSLLEKIQEFTVWAGRYPIPTDSEAMRPRATLDGGFAPRTYHQQGEDWPTIRSFFTRFMDDLKQLQSQ